MFYAAQCGTQTIRNRMPVRVAKVTFCLIPLLGCGRGNVLTVHLIFFEQNNLDSMFSLHLAD